MGRLCAGAATQFKLTGTVAELISGTLSPKAFLPRRRRYQNFEMPTGLVLATCYDPTVTTNTCECNASIWGKTMRRNDNSIHLDEYASNSYLHALVHFKSGRTASGSFQRFQWALQRWLLTPRLLCKLAGLRSRGKFPV